MRIGGDHHDVHYNTLVDGVMEVWRDADPWKLCGMNRYSKMEKNLVKHISDLQPGFKGAGAGSGRNYPLAQVAQLDETSAANTETRPAHAADGVSLPGTITTAHTNNKSPGADKSINTQPWYNGMGCWKLTGETVKLNGIIDINIIKRYMICYWYYFNNFLNY
jgi:hypothetical protein